MYRSVVEQFIVPAYGHVAVEEVEQQHIAKLHFELRDIPCQANRALEIGVKLFNLAEEWRLRTGGNPCRFVHKYRETKRERFLTDEEFRRLGEVLSELEVEGSLPVHPAAAIRLLMLTGCRRNETRELRLSDGMTGHVCAAVHTLFFRATRSSAGHNTEAEADVRMLPKYTQRIQETARNLDTRISEINDFRQAVNLLALWRA